MGKFVLLLSFGILVHTSSAYTQHIDYSSHQNNNLISGLWKDIKNISHDTFSTENYPSWKLISYAGFAAVLFFGTDMEIREEYGLEKEFNPIGLPKHFGNIGTLYDKPGTGYFTAGLVGILYSNSKIFNNSKLEKTTELVVKSLLITGVVTSVLKVAIGRERPYVNGGPDVYKPFSFDPDYMSMPSGHSSSIFAMMTVIAKQYDAWYIKIPAYVFAASVTAQRIHTDKHWSSDVLIGSTIGYLISSSIVKRYHYKNHQIDMSPTINTRGIGVNIQF